MTGIEMIGKLIAAHFEYNEKTDDIPSLKEYMELYAKLRIEESELKSENEAHEAEAKLCETKKENERLNEKLAEAINRIRQLETQQKVRGGNSTEEESAAPPAEMKNAQDHPANGFAPALIFHGKGSSEKREIHERLLQFWKKNGLGSLRKLAEATNGVLDTERIRDMMNGAKAELATWKVVGAALDYLETKEGKTK